MMALYILENRFLHPFNFLNRYAGYRAPMNVHIAPAMWCLFIGCLVLSFALALVIPASFFNRCHARFMRIKRARFAFAAAALAFLSATLVNFLVYENIPKNLDEIGYLFQAHNFAAGKLYSQAPLEGFHGFMNIVTDNEGKIYGAHFPGTSLVQVPGVLLGQPWVTGPLLGALGILILYALVHRIYGESLARYTVLFALVSPFYIFMNGTFMSHPVTAFFTLLFCYFFYSMVMERRKPAAFLCGLFFALLLVTRPLTCMMVTLPFLLYLLVQCVRQRASLLPALVTFLLPVVMILGLFAGYVKVLTGDPLVLPTSIQNPAFSPGFGDQKGIPVRQGKRAPFYPSHGINQMLSKTVMLGVDLYGWGGFSLIFIPFVLAAPGRNRWDLIFLLAVLLITLNFFFLPVKGMIYGPRTFFAAVPFLFILTVRGMQGLAAILSRIRGEGAGGKIYVYCIHALAIFVFLCTLRSMVEYIPMKVEKYIHIHPRFLLDFDNIEF